MRTQTRSISGTVVAAVVVALVLAAAAAVLQPGDGSGKDSRAVNITVTPVNPQGVKVVIVWRIGASFSVYPPEVNIDSSARVTTVTDYEWHMSGSAKVGELVTLSAIVAPDDTGTVNCRVTIAGMPPYDQRNTRICSYSQIVA